MLPAAALRCSMEHTIGVTVRVGVRGGIQFMVTVRVRSQGHGKGEGVRGRIQFMLTVRIRSQGHGKGEGVWVRV